MFLTGALGMLGRRVHERFADGWDVVATARTADAARGVRALDVTDAAAVHAAVAAARPDVIVNCAAYTAVDRAETERALAWRVNAEAPGAIADAATRAGAFVIHVSSDFVFDGEKGAPYVESDPTGPRGAYAESKAGGERAVRDRAPAHAIVRTQWLYGRDGRHFPGTMLRLAREGRPLRVVFDQVGCPTLSDDVARVLRLVAGARIGGVVHAANRGRASWWEFARAVLRRAGVVAPVEPITTDEFAAPAPRPAFSVLRNAVLEATIGDVMRPWEDALAAFADMGGLLAPASG